MKALIEIAPRGSVFAAARAQISSSQATGQDADFLLRFESARSLFSELTPARMDVLELLRRIGPCSVYALAKAAQRNYSNIHADTKRLIELGLVERAEGGEVIVPFSEVDIHFPLLKNAA
jgi:predicted transcriptional regulator